MYCMCVCALMCVSVCVCVYVCTVVDWDRRPHGRVAPRSKASLSPTIFLRQHLNYYNSYFKNIFISVACVHSIKCRLSWFISLYTVLRQYLYETEYVHHSIYLGYAAPKVNKVYSINLVCALVWRIPVTSKFRGYCIFALR